MVLVKCSCCPEPWFCVTSFYGHLGRPRRCRVFVNRDCLGRLVVWGRSAQRACIVWLSIIFGRDRTLPSRVVSVYVIFRGWSRRIWSLGVKDKSSSEVNWREFNVLWWLLILSRTKQLEKFLSLQLLTDNSPCFRSSLSVSGLYQRRWICMRRGLTYWDSNYDNLCWVNVMCPFAMTSCFPVNQ